MNIEHRTSNIEHPMDRCDGLVSRFFRWLSSGGSWCLIFLVRVYRVTLSPAKTFLFGPAAECRFEPGCSQYAIEALETHGAVAGGWLAAKRICRCHPWGECGKDPVPPKKFRVSSSEFRVPKAQFRT